jgi:hypothetical protein
MEMKVNERIAGHRASVLSGQNFSQICPAFHRKFLVRPLSVAFVRVDRPLRRAMQKNAASPAQISIEHGTARSTQQHSLFVAALLYEAKSAVILSEAKDL